MSGKCWKKTKHQCTTVRLLSQCFSLNTPLKSNANLRNHCRIVNTWIMNLAGRDEQVAYSSPLTQYYPGFSELSGLWILNGKKDFYLLKLERMWRIWWHCQWILKVVATLAVRKLVSIASNRMVDGLSLRTSTSSRCWMMTSRFPWISWTTVRCYFVDRWNVETSRIHNGRRSVRSDNQLYIGPIMYNFESTLQALASLE